AFHELLNPVHYEEREIGRAMQAHRGTDERRMPLFALDWAQHETMNYYGDAKAEYINPITQGGETLKAPVYLMTTTIAENYFFAGVDVPRSGYENVKVLYQGELLVLMYSDTDVKIPIFGSH